MSTGAKHLPGDRPEYLSACPRLTRFRPSAPPSGNIMNDEMQCVERVNGLDSHPDSFTAAILRGSTPGSAVGERTFHKVPPCRLQSRGKQHTTPQDLLVLEAADHSSQVVRVRDALG